MLTRPITIEGSNILQIKPIIAKVSAFGRVRGGFLVALATLMPLAAPAQADPLVPTVIVDASTGEVLQSEEATRPWFPASTTKLMSAYVAMRAVAAGEITWDTPIIVSPNAARQPPSKIGARAGQELTLENALKILMVKSANDVATIVAEGVAGSVPAFAARMNREAARLGMRESHFVNPHGLHDPAQVTSARDMALLSRALLLEFPAYRDLFSIGAVRLGNRIYHNTNGLIGRYSGAIGMKTGFICASGFNLVSAAERNGRTLIAVVFGAATAADRTLKAAQLLDQGFGGGGFWGNSGSGRDLHALTASIETQAPNRRAEICGRRGPPASEEEDVSGGIIEATNALDRPDRIIVGAARISEAASVGQRQGDRIVLGVRAPSEPILVYLGRKPGSDALARGPGSPTDAAANQAAQAFAPAKAAIATGAPLKLPSAILQTPAKQTIANLPASARAKAKQEPAAKQQSAAKQQTPSKKHAENLSTGKKDSKAAASAKTAAAKVTAQKRAPSAKATETTQ